MEGKSWIFNKILENNPRKILDIGAGCGTYSGLLKRKGYVYESIDAIEIWKPYIEEFQLDSEYDNVYNVDVRNWNNFDYDLVIFGDVLEHMKRSDAVLVWNAAAEQAGSAVISIPIVSYPQGELNGNPYERHIEEHWTHDEIINTFSHIDDYFAGEIIGSYWANFKEIL